MIKIEIKILISKKFAIPEVDIKTKCNDNKLAIT